MDLKFNIWKEKYPHSKNRIKDVIEKIEICKKCPNYSIINNELTKNEDVFKCNLCNCNLFQKIISLSNYNKCPLNKW